MSEPLEEEEVDPLPRSRGDASPHVTRCASPQQPAQQRRIRRALLVVTALSTFLLVGATFGWGPMQLLLEQHGVFATECRTDEEVEQLETQGVCNPQTDKLIRVGLIAQLSIVTSPALGVLYDKIGGPNSAAVMSITSLVGMGIVAIAIQGGQKTENLLYLGFTLMALASSMGSILIVGLSFYFHDHAASRVIFILNTLFDSGAMTFWVLWFLQDITNADLLYIWTGYLVLAVFIHGTGDILWRLAMPHHKVTEDNVETEHIIESCQPTTTQTNNSNETDAPPRKETPPDPQSTKEEVEGDENGEQSVQARNESFSLEQPQESQIPFACLLTFFSLHVMGVSWNFATQRDFLGDLGDDEHDNLYLTIFTLSTPLSIVGAPFMDWCILHLGWINSLQVVNVLGLGFSTIKVVTTNLNAQIVGFVIFSFCRSFIFGLSFSFLPKIVKGSVIGRAQGILAGMAGLLNLVNIPMASFAVNQMEGDFFWPNLFYVLVYIPCFISILVLGRNWKPDDFGKTAKEKKDEKTMNGETTHRPLRTPS